MGKAITIKEIKKGDNLKNGIYIDKVMWFSSTKEYVHDLREVTKLKTFKAIKAYGDYMGSNSLKIAHVYIYKVVDGKQYLLYKKEFNGRNRNWKTVNVRIN